MRVETEDHSALTEDMPEVDRTHPSVFSIVLAWAVISFTTVLISAFVSSQIMGMTLVISISVSLIAVGFSILHPGGWLGLAGLIIAIRKRSYVWLILSDAGSTLTGITVPMLEAIGASSM